VKRILVVEDGDLEVDCERMKVDGAWGVFSKLMEGYAFLRKIRGALANPVAPLSDAGHP
jgi:hypothetical protein